MAGAPAFVMVVLSVILKVRECSLPAIVNVFARLSTAEIIPWNGIARALLASVVVLLESAVVLAAGELVVLAAGELDVLGAGEAFVLGVAEAIGLGDGEADFFGAAFAASGTELAKATANAVMRRSLFFICLELELKLYRVRLGSAIVIRGWI